jgi:hypothetical protein
MTPEEREQRCLALVNEIMAVLSGIPYADAQAALTIAVTAAIVTSCDGDGDRRDAAFEFTRQVHQWLQDPNRVEWINSSIIGAPATPTTQ